MGSCRWMLAAVCGTVLAGAALGEIVVGQYTPGYVLGTDYQVLFDSQIRILRPSIYGPYDFDCYDADDGNRPADIQAIVVDIQSGTGSVEIEVTDHQGYGFGARDVQLLQVNQSGYTCRIVDFSIENNLGNLDDPYLTPSYVQEITGNFVVRGNLVCDLHVGTVTSSGAVEIGILGHLAAGDLLVDGDLAGSIVPKP